jgi:flagella basal body P-ring formation protein FlgA
VRYIMRRLAKKGIFSTLLLFFLLLCGVFYGDRGISSSLSMKEVVILHKEEISVGDIISTGTPSSGLSERFLAEPISLSPDRIHIIPSRMIRELLQPARDSMSVIIGRRTAVVPYRVMTRLSSSFAEEFCRFLLDECEGGEGKVEVELLTFPSLSEDAGSGDYSFRFLQANRFNGMLTGDAVVEYSFKNGEDEMKRRNMYISIRLSLPVLRAARALRQGEMLNRDALMVTEENISAFTGEFLPASESCEQYMVRTDIQTGELILKRNLTKRIDVRAGDRVTIVVRKGSILLMMGGKAYNSGSLGDEVRVRPSDSDTWLTAKVTGEKEVGIGI